MEQEPKKDKKINPFVDGMFKNVGREITVVVSTPDGVKKITGMCEAVELQQKGIIVRDAENTYFIKNYLWIARPRKKTE